MRIGSLLACLSLAILMMSGCSAGRKDFARAARLENEGKNEAALREYIAIAASLTVKNDPRLLAQAYVSIGECEWKLDRPSEAFRAFSKAAELDPNNSAAQLQLAKLFMTGGAPERAMIAAEIVLSQDPNNLDAMTAAGSAAADEGRRHEAIDRLERVLSRDPKRVDAAVLLSGVYSEIGKPEEARATLRNVSKNSPRDPAALLALGRLEEEEGHLDAAEAAYRQAVVSNDNAQTELRLAQFLARSARSEEAAALLEKVDNLKPSESWKLADFQLRLGKPGLASQRYLRALPSTHDPRSRSRMLARAIEAQLALAAAAQERPRELALTNARALLLSNRGEFSPSDVQLLTAEVALAEGNLEDALKSAQTAAESSPDSAVAHYLLGAALQRSDKPLLARQEWQKALELDEDFVPARIASSRDALAAGDLSTAQHMVAAVVRHEPENMEALHLFARVLLARKEYASAQVIATRAVTLQKKSPAAYVLLGDINLAARHAGPALLDYEQALLISPDCAPAMEGLVRTYRMGKISRPMLLRIERVGGNPPPSATLLELAGRLFAEHGWMEDARRCFRKSLQADPARKSAARELSALARQTGDSDQALLLAARTGETNRALFGALAAQDAGQNETAIREYEQAVHRGERSGAAANNLAWLYAEKGANLDRALQLAIRARDFRPQSAAVNDTLGYVLLKRREYSRAVGVLEHTAELLRLEKSPNPTVQEAVRRHLAEAYRSSGETEKADAITRDPGALQMLGSE